MRFYVVTRVGGLPDNHGKGGRRCGNLCCKDAQTKDPGMRAISFFWHPPVLWTAETQVWVSTRKETLKVDQTRACQWCCRRPPRHRRLRTLRLLRRNAFLMSLPTSLLWLEAVLLREQRSEPSFPSGLAVAFQVADFFLSIVEPQRMELQNHKESAGIVVDEVNRSRSV